MPTFARTVGVGVAVTVCWALSDPVLDWRLPGPLEERPMSTQPCCAEGSGAAVPLVVAGLIARRRSATPSPEPFGLAKLHFAVAVPSTGVMISCAAWVTGL